MRRLLPMMLLSACLDTSLPAQPPPPGSGIVQGTLVWVEPGQGTLRPAVGATIELVGTGVKTTASGETGFFSLSPVDSSATPLLIRFDADGDGRQERQRVIDLGPLKAGRGKSISIGQLTVGNNAFVRGVVRRADVSGRTGHAGTAIVIPETPYFRYTGDDGSFLFDNLPEGPLRLATFREGYASVAERLELVGGTVVELAPRTIERLTGPQVARVQGKVFLPEGTPAADVAVQLSGGSSARTDATGAYSFTGVPYGLYSVAFVKEGFLTALQVKVVVTAPVIELRDVTLAPGTSSGPMFEGPLPAYDGGVELDAGSDAGMDAGSDAGMDAGSDAGMDAGSDAGMDAGSDAGMDAGSDAGMDAGGDAGMDAGSDAGSVVLPVARIQGPASVTPGGAFTLNALTSTGEPLLEYRWTQTSGPTVTFPTLDPTLLGSPNLTAPATASLLRFTLTVRDGNGQTSLPASIIVPVGRPPTARITASFNLMSGATGGQRVFLSGGTSTDLDGTGIASYEWVVGPPDAGIGVTPLDGGVTLQLDMPPNVAPPLSVTARLNVTNGITIRSATPAIVNFPLATGSVPMWYVDAGIAQGVSGGAMVTLRGQAFGPPTANFIYSWSPDREPASGTPDFILSDATSTEPIFIAPIVEGAIPRLITFTLTATDTSGTLTPSSQSVRTFVQVNDRKPPVLVSTSITDAGTGPIGWVYLEYDEPLGSGQAQAGVVTGSPAPVNAVIAVSGKRAYTIFRPPLQPGYPYTLTQAIVADMNGNLAAPFAQPFITAASWTPAFESLGASVAEPRPGLVVRRGATPFSNELFVFGRNETSPWFFRPVNPFGCPVGPCQLVDEPSSPIVTLTGPPVRSHKGWLVNERPVAQLQVADFQGTTGMVFELTDAGWTSVPPPPNSIFSDGRTLSSVSFDAGIVSHVVLDGGAWTPVSTIVTNTTEYATDATATPFAYGSALFNANPTVVLKSSRSSTHTLFSYGTQWLQSGAASGAGVDARSTGFATAPGPGYALWSTAGGVLELRTTSGFNSSPVTGVTSFDLIPSYNMFMAAVVVGGQLQLRSLGNSSTLPLVAGVTRNGVPGSSLNNDPSCEAARPELATNQYWQIFVTWQERCGAGPWRVYVRALE